MALAKAGSSRGWQPRKVELGRVAGAPSPATWKKQVVYLSVPAGLGGQAVGANHHLKR